MAGGRTDGGSSEEQKRASVRRAQQRLVMQSEHSAAGRTTGRKADHKTLNIAQKRLKNGK
jgi:hypothetical protein